MGYKLKAILSRSAKFSKNGSDFILSLEKIDSSSSFTRLKKQDVGIESLEDVSRDDISYYSKHPNQIWRDISIEEINDGKSIRGFKITKINKNSRFANLGLKKGDLIIKANNIRLRSYRDALQIYKNIDNYDTVQIVVMRNNQEVELVYEIN